MCYNIFMTYEHFSHSKEETQNFLVGESHVVMLADSEGRGLDHQVWLELLVKLGESEQLIVEFNPFDEQGLWKSKSDLPSLMFLLASEARERGKPVIDLYNQTPSFLDMLDFLQFDQRLRMILDLFWFGTYSIGLDEGLKVGILKQNIDLFIESARLLVKESLVTVKELQYVKTLLYRLTQNEGRSVGLKITLDRLYGKYRDIYYAKQFRNANKAMFIIGSGHFHGVIEAYENLHQAEVELKNEAERVLFNAVRLSILKCLY